MHFFYAQIQPDTGVCICVSTLSGPVDAPHMIPLEEPDSSLCGKIWNGSEWIDPPAPEPEPEPEPEPDVEGA